MPSAEPSLELDASLWMTLGGKNFGGHGRIALLALIAEHGSITHAAKAMKMSYKAAWDAVDAMNNLAGEPLVERMAGGRGGGGTRLTERGGKLVQNFRTIEQEHRRFVGHLNHMVAGATDDLLLIRRMSMRTSARNQFLGAVSKITRGAVNDEVELTLPGGEQRIVAIVTRDSTQSLGLQPGTEAFALVKASSVILATEMEGARFSARNRLSGRVEQVRFGAVNSEVIIGLGQGLSIAAIVTQESARALDLREGMEATALFKASSVILGVPA